MCAYVFDEIHDVVERVVCTMLGEAHVGVFRVAAFARWELEGCVAERETCFEVAVLDAVAEAEKGFDAFR
jgi:hypothetical protein